MFPNLPAKKLIKSTSGSCTNGRIDDLRIVASIIKRMGGRISNNVRCIVVPATQHIYERALQEGLLEIFAKAGCFISGPTCGACLGMSYGVLAPAKFAFPQRIAIFPGRMGKDGMVHLASPATATFTAIKGVITEPDIELCEIAMNDERRAPLFTAVCPTDWKEKESTKPNYASLLADIGSEQKKDFSGQVFYLPVDNVDTDQIIPAKYLTETKRRNSENTVLKMRFLPRIGVKLFQSQILVAGENFGCGSSREHADGP